MDKEKQPGISFDGIMLIEEKFKRDANVPQKIGIELEGYSNCYNIDKQYFNEIKLVVKGLDEEDKEVLILETMFVGLFSVEEENENMDINKYLKDFSPALMFPYIREHISSITQKAGIKPILIPPINLAALLKEKE